MAGHSHSANIKYRKGRQDQNRSQFFLKLRKKIENIIREEGKVSEKLLSVARENQFPKEKVYQIWTKVKNDKKSLSSTNAFFQAQFGIFIYWENNTFLSNDLINELKLKEMPLSLVPSYFQLSHSLKLNLKKEKEKYNIEEYLLTYFPVTLLEKVNYDEKKIEFTSTDKKLIKKLKEFIEKNEMKLEIEEEKTSWKTLNPCRILPKGAMVYWKKLKKELGNNKFYANVQE